MTADRLYRQCLPATLLEVDAVCLHIRQMLLQGVTVQKDRFALELLAREAVGNAVRHGCKEDAAKRVWVTFRLGRRRASLRVRDEGPGFDWQAGLAHPADDEASHGRGLPLYHQYAQRCLFGASGNDVLLIRNLLEATMTAPTPNPPPPPAPTPGSASIQPGDLTASTVEAVRAQLKALLQQGVQHLVVDLDGVQMVDSTGIGLLIQAHNSLSRISGTLTVTRASEDIKGLFQSMRLDKRFNLQD